jgi:protein-tyrosine phosphatase
MGGAHSHVGALITLEAAGQGWFVDCAGDMPAAYREASRRWIQCVFADLDHRPPNLHYIEQNVRELAMASQHPQRPGTHPVPADVYILCQHGMNRSGLVAGLLLRSLGMTGDEAVRRIAARRVGSLSNLAFRDIVLRGV